MQASRLVVAAIVLITGSPSLPASAKLAALAAHEREGGRGAPKLDESVADESEPGRGAPKLDESVADESEPGRGAPKLDESVADESEGGQWLHYPTAGIPRTPDGKPDLSAPAPKTPDGKPDIAGLWQPASGWVVNIAKDLKDENVPYQAWAKALFDQRKASNSLDDPTARCIPGGVPRANLVPYPFKIFHTSGMVVILYEAVHSYRQIFTDGRHLPEDPNPTWMGYSVGRWEDDGFVVHTEGFNDTGWLDNSGRPATERLHVTERFRRKDFGHMDVQITIDDSKAYTRPWTVTLPLTFVPDTDLLEYVCNENNKYFELIPKDAASRRN